MSIYYVFCFVIFYDNIVFQVRWQFQVVDVVFYVVEDCCNIVVIIQDKDFYVRIVVQGLCYIWFGIDCCISILMNVFFVCLILFKIFMLAGSDCILQVFINFQFLMKVIQKSGDVSWRNSLVLWIIVGRLVQQVLVDFVKVGIQLFYSFFVCVKQFLEKFFGFYL